MSLAKKTVKIEKKVNTKPKVDPKDKVIEDLLNQNHALILGLTKVGEENKTINLMWSQDLKCLVTKLGGEVYIDPITAEVGNDPTLRVIQNFDGKGGVKYILIKEQEVEK